MRRRLLLARGRWLRQTNEGGIRGKRTGGSQRCRRNARRGRGRSGADEFDGDGRRVRGRRQRRWRRSKALRLVSFGLGMWCSIAELLGTATGRGVAGGHGYGERRSQVRSVTRGRESRGGGGGPESEGEVRGGRGGAWRHRSAQAEEEAGRQGGGGRGAWPRAPGACSSSWQRRKATEKEAVVGWAGFCSRPHR